MITQSKLKEIIDKADSKGYKVKVRDIGYVILCEQFEDKELAFKLVYGENSNFTPAFDTAPSISYLKDYFKYSMKADELTGVAEAKMSFDENKKEMIKLLNQTQRAMDDGLIEAKDALRIMADIRVKLNDKFQVTDRSQQSLIVVEPKFNDRCSCGREIYVPTIDDLKKKYNLVERK